MSMRILKPMISCARKTACAALKPVPPPICPPPPPKRFPWFIVWGILSFYALMGLMYKIYLYREANAKSDENKIIWRPRAKNKKPVYDTDLPPCVQYLIIGAGAAGWAAYRAIKEHDKTAKVFFISRDDIMPYRLPPMSKTMWWNPEPPDISKLNYLNYAEKRFTMYNAECRDFMDPVKFYRKKTGPAVAIATGYCVSHIDADDHVAYVSVATGERPIYYERCLLAPGAKPKTLPTFKYAPRTVRERICHLRGIRDLEIAYRRVQEAKSVAVIGGGTMGTELAYHIATMKKKGARPEDAPPLEVLYIYKDKGILSGFLPEYLGVWLSEKLRCQGVKLVPQNQVYDIYESKDGRLELTLSNGTNLVTDYVFIAIGVKPREDLAEPSFLELDKENGGFLVNTEMEARKHLYIAGDAASTYIQWKDSRMRFEHYDNAVQEGNIAGANMTGYWTPCNMEPHFEVVLDKDLDMEVVGEVGACMPTVGLFKECDIEPHYFKEHEREKGDADRKCFKQGGKYEAMYKHGILFYFRDEVVTGIIFWNMIPPIENRYEVASEILRAQPTLKDLDTLADLLGFENTRCIFRQAPGAAEVGPCISNRKEW